jgi:hypothetical protein
VIVIGIEPGDVEDVYKAVVVHCGEKQEGGFRGVGCSGCRRCGVHIDYDSMLNSLRGFVCGERT